MAILALDMGLAKTGWVVFENKKPVSAGIVKTETMRNKTHIRSADDTCERVQRLFRELTNLCRTHAIRGIIAELPSGGSKSATAAKSMTAATAVVGCLVEGLGLPAEWPSPSEGKRAATGNSNGSKDQVMAAMLARWPELAPYRKKLGKGKFEDVADAAAAFAASENGQLVRAIG